MVRYTSEIVNNKAYTTIEIISTFSRSSTKIGLNMHKKELFPVLINMAAMITTAIHGKIGIACAS